MARGTDRQYLNIPVFDALKDTIGEENARVVASSLTTVDMVATRVDADADLVKLLQRLMITAFVGLFGLTGWLVYDVQDLKAKVDHLTIAVNSKP